MKYKVHRARFVEYVPRAIHCFAFEDLKDPTRAALSRADGSIEIWNVANDWHQELIIPGCNGNSVEALDWCRDRLFTAGLHAEITEWDLDTVRLKVSINSFGGAVWCLKVNYARTHLAAGCEDGRVRLFDIAPCGLSYDRSLNQEEGRVLSLSWHPSDKTLVTGGSDSTVRVYSVSTGQCTLRITMDEFHTRSTLTWAIHITSDYVIITGDSLGNTQFWDGKQGTLIQSFRAHSADVLALCVNEKENMVFSGGVDSKLVQFQLIRNKDGVANWVRGGSVRNYSQDVRTLATLGGNKNLLFSGGLDTCVTVYSTKEFGRSNVRVRQISSFPHSPIIFVAAEASVLMYQMSGGLQFWRLGETDAASTTITIPPAQLLRINKKGDHHILCSAISPCGAWAVFSDAYRISLFRLNLAADEPSKVTVSKVPCLPEDLSPAHKLVFTPDSSKLICGGSQGTIQVLDLTGEPVLSHTFDIPGGDNRGLAAVCLLAVSCDGHWLACADRSNTVNVFSLKKAKHHNTLPKLESRLTAMAFQPKTNHLAVVCCSHQIYMFTSKSGKLTDWSRQACEHGLPKQWFQRYCKVINIEFSPSCHEIMLLQDHDMFALLDLREPLPSTDVVLYESRFQTRKRKHVTSNEPIATGHEQQALRVCRKYVPLLHAGFTKDSSLVVVERPWVSILETLPPTLERKKFGT